MNTYSNRRVANHLHGLIFELKERMNSRQDRPVMQKKRSTRKKNFSRTKLSADVVKPIAFCTEFKLLRLNSPKSIC
jgi:hypothetical protein